HDVRENREDVPVRLVLGADDAAARRNVLGAGDFGLEPADHPQEPQARRTPIAGNTPAKARALGKQAHRPREQRADHRVADIKDIKDGRAERLNGGLDGHRVPRALRLCSFLASRHRLGELNAQDASLRYLRTVSREVIAVSAAITGTTARMKATPSQPRRNRPKSTPTCALASVGSTLPAAALISAKKRSDSTAPSSPPCRPMERNRPWNSPAMNLLEAPMKCSTSTISRFDAMAPR